MVDETTPIESLKETLLDRKAGIAERNRAAYWLREQGAKRAAREALLLALKQRGDSQLLRHEVAYILGQLGYDDVASDLQSIVCDTSDDEIVRHEAAEALGALGLGIETLEKYKNDSAQCVAETCRLALENIAYHNGKPKMNNSFHSVDPAPPLDTKSVEECCLTLLNPQNQIWQRYRAMFALRDNGTTPAIQALCQALLLPKFQLQSELLRHEIAFVLGQLATPQAKLALESALRDLTLHPMVRHEAAEALGALENNNTTFQNSLSDLLISFQSDRDLVVAQSCQVALDAMAYYATPSQSPYS
mmetsp:Transcript_19095/g.24765  ORF Transcript_19095/g.24765 Transcript_19095/m.24765 type:complete len:304 (-) Transcript_19095:1800-2711(-)